MLILLASLVAISLVAIVFALIASMSGMTKIVPTENRMYMDPLPGVLRLLWPIVNLVTYHSARWVSEQRVKKVEDQLRLTSLLFLMTARQFISLQFISMVLFTLLAVAGSAMLRTFSPVILGGAALLGYFYPRIWTQGLRRRHVNAMLKHLPVYLDFLTLAVEAGLNITGAIQKCVEKGPDGPFQRELEHVMRDLKSGLSRTDALRRFEQRQGIKEISNLVSAILQADRMGTGLSVVLRFQSDQRRVERFQRAEKQAMEAPVKLVFPLLMFIFPVTFIVLGFPIVMKFVQDGLL